MTNDIKDFQNELNRAIEQLKLDKQPKKLYEPIAYTLSMGGKRMRPILAIMAYMTKKSDWKSIIAPALSVELFHNFTLIHDDIMDEAPLRRGKATVYKKWNKDIAILSGDALMILAYDLLLEANEADLKYILQLFNKAAIEVCEGQQYDMDFEEMQEVREEEYIKMIKLKTAVLLGYSLEMGALLAGISKENAARFREFGTYIGIGFQLKDDILDVYGDQAKFGKQVGGDIIANKKTFLLIKAMENAKGTLKKELEQWLAIEEFDPQEKVKAVTNIYQQLNIQQLAEDKMNEYFAMGFEALDALQQENLTLAPLRQFAKELIDREN